MQNTVNKDIVMNQAWPTFAKGDATPLLPKKLYQNLMIGPVKFEFVGKYFGELLAREERSKFVGLKIKFTADNEDTVQIEVNDVNNLNGIPFDAIEPETLEQYLTVSHQECLETGADVIDKAILSSDGQLVLLSEAHTKSPRLV